MERLQSSSPDVVGSVGRDTSSSSGATNAIAIRDHLCNTSGEKSNQSTFPARQSRVQSPTGLPDNHDIISLISPELKENITSYMTVEDLSSMRRTSRRWQDFLSYDHGGPAGIRCQTTLGMMRSLHKLIREIDGRHLLKFADMPRALSSAQRSKLDNFQNKPKISPLEEVKDAVISLALPPFRPHIASPSDAMKVMNNMLGIRKYHELGDDDQPNINDFIYGNSPKMSQEQRGAIVEKIASFPFETSRACELVKFGSSDNIKRMNKNQYETAVKIVAGIKHENLKVHVLSRLWRNLEDLY